MKGKKEKTTKKQQKWNIKKFLCVFISVFILVFLGGLAFIYLSPQNDEGLVESVQAKGDLTRILFDNNQIKKETIMPSKEVDFLICPYTTEWYSSVSPEESAQLNSLLEQCNLKLNTTKDKAFIRIANTIADNFSYDYETQNDSWHEMLITKKGTCHAYVDLCCILCQLCGIRCEEERGLVSDAPHAWVKVFFEGHPYYSDITFFDEASQNRQNPNIYLLSERLWEDHIPKHRNID